MPAKFWYYFKYIKGRWDTASDVYHKWIIQIYCISSYQLFIKYIYVDLTLHGCNEKKAGWIIDQ